MIRLTFVSDTHRGAPREYGTDDLAEAMAAEADRGFRLHPSAEGFAQNRGPDTWIFAFVVERDGARVPQEEVAQAFTRIASLERLRGDR